jgi:hypothetical protein
LGRSCPCHAGRFRPTASHWVGLRQARGMPGSERVALRLRLPEAVVTWFVTGSRPRRPPWPSAHAGRPRAPVGRAAAGQRAAASPDPGHLFSFMIWFIAIGAVIVRGAVAGATCDQRKAVPGTPRPGHRVIGTAEPPARVPEAGIHPMSCDRWRPTSPRLSRLAGAPELLASARRTPSTATTLPRRGGCRAGRAERPRIMTAALAC